MQVNMYSALINYSLTLLSQRSCEPGQLIFTCSNCAAKSSGVICFIACSKVLAFAACFGGFFATSVALDFAAVAFVLRGDLLLEEADAALDVDLAGESDLLFVLLLFILLLANKLRYCCVGTVDKQYELIYVCICCWTKNN